MSQLSPKMAYQKGTQWDHRPAITTMPGIAWICSSCHLGLEKPEKRLPRGWHRLPDMEQPHAYCSKCWAERYLLRAVTIPVATPLDQDWPKLLATLHEMWQLTTQASNWMMTELYTRDVKRAPGDEKMPAMARQYLYPEARQRFPSLPSRSIAALEHTVHAKYRAVRFQVNWTATASLPTFRYPMPFALPNQGWRVHIEEEGQRRIIVSARIGEERVEFVLKSAKFHRQRRAVQKIVSGEAIQGELALYMRGKSLMAKLVAWLPRDEKQKPQHNVLSVRTSAHELLVALDHQGERIWKVNADHLRRWNAAHRTQLQRWSEDQKAEQRPVPTFAARREAATRKYRHRMNTAIQQIAAQLVNFARRRKVGVLRYDDSCKDFAEFPRFEFRERIQVLCNERGIRFEDASGELVEKSSESLADRRIKE